MIALFQVYIPSSFLPWGWINRVQSLPGFGSDCTPGNPCRFQPGLFISRLLPNIIVGAGVIFFFLILAGGWGVLSSAGHDVSAQDKAKAQAALTYGVAGFLLVVSAYFILQIIVTITGIDFLNPPI